MSAYEGHDVGRKRPDLCAANGHPLVTYNPHLFMSWCLCGEVTANGDGVTWPKADLRGGPLFECHTPGCDCGGDAA